MSLTRRDLRRKIAGDMRDLLLLTAHSGSSENLIVDRTELGDFDNTLVSSQLMATSGPNAGHIARVTGSSQSGKSISFDPPLPAPPEVGDEFELVNLRGTGFRFQEYHRVIDSIVGANRDRWLVTENSDPLAFTPDAPFLPLPDHWRGIFGVSVVLPDGSDYPFKPARNEGARGWHCDRATRTVTFGGSDIDLAMSGPVILHGLIPHPDLADDDDVLYMDNEWVALQAASKLAQRRGDREWNQWAVEWARMASGERPAKLFRYPANTVLVEPVR